MSDLVSRKLIEIPDERATVELKNLTMTEFDVGAVAVTLATALQDQPHARLHYNATGLAITFPWSEAGKLLVRATGVDVPTTYNGEEVSADTFSLGAYLAPNSVMLVIPEAALIESHVIATSFGDVHAEVNGGALNINTQLGGITVKGKIDEVHVYSREGDISLEGVHIGSSGDAQTESGNLSVVGLTGPNSARFTINR